MFLRQDLAKKIIEEKKQRIQQLEGYLHSPVFFYQYLLTFSRNERIDVLLNHIGKTKLSKAGLFQTTYSIYKLAKKVPSSQLLDFIKAMYTQEELYKLRDTNWYWEKIKTKLSKVSKEACEKLNQLTYTEDDLAAKHAIKQLKKTILNTNWQFRFFEHSINTSFKHHVVTIPEVIDKQIDEIIAVTRREKSHSEALQAIKTLGKSEYDNRNSLPSQIISLFSARTNIDTYLDNFADDTSFNLAFSKPKL